ncbi:hypothetical protein [Deinococcus sp. QL22]|uniref:hypothetical protein n=1 Tax=Deinococcus sp. QL22 TaxID=2939437 RepID=UPI002016BD4E|nr:hypothetical protein [Deinococcus sp. QL22]UQN06275.1 hypothetical protein M1R55_15665 [Deinococcus sp. QL22]
MNDAEFLRYLTGECCCCCEDERAPPPVPVRPQGSTQNRAVTPVRRPARDEPFVPPRPFDFAPLPLIGAGTLVASGAGDWRAILYSTAQRLELGVTGLAELLQSTLVGMNLPFPTTFTEELGRSQLLPVASTTSGNTLLVLYSVRANRGGFYPAYALIRLDPQQDTCTLVGTALPELPVPVTYDPPADGEWIGNAGGHLTRYDPFAEPLTAATEPWASIVCEEGSLRAVGLIEYSRFVGSQHEWRDYWIDVRATAGSLTATFGTSDQVVIGPGGNVVSSTPYRGWVAFTTGSTLPNSLKLGASGGLPDGRPAVLAGTNSDLRLMALGEDGWTTLASAAGNTAQVDADARLAYLNVPLERHDQLFLPNELIIRRPIPAGLGRINRTGGVLSVGNRDDLAEFTHRYRDHRTNQVVSILRGEVDLGRTGAPLTVTHTARHTAEDVTENRRLRVRVDYSAGLRVGDAVTLPGVALPLVVLGATAQAVEVRPLAPVTVAKDSVLMALSVATAFWNDARTGQVLPELPRLPLVHGVPLTSDATPSNQPRSPGFWQGDLAKLQVLRDPDGSPSFLRTPHFYGLADDVLTLTFMGRSPTDLHSLVFSVRLLRPGTATAFAGGTAVQRTLAKGRWTQLRFPLGNAPYTTLTLSADVPIQLSSAYSEATP